MNAIKSLKAKYTEYYADVPIQKYAAMYIGRDEDTIMRWRNEDADFAESVDRAKAEWIRQKVVATKPNFALERLEKSIFSSKATYEMEIRTEPDEKLAGEFAEFLKQRR